MAQGQRSEARTVSVAVSLNAKHPLGIATGPGEAQ